VHRGSLDLVGHLDPPGDVFNRKLRDIKHGLDGNYQLLVAGSSDAQILPDDLHLILRIAERGEALSDAG